MADNQTPGVIHGTTQHGVEFALDPYTGNYTVRYPNIEPAVTIRPGSVGGPTVLVDGYNPILVNLTFKPVEVEVCKVPGRESTSLPLHPRRP